METIGMRMDICLTWHDDVHISDMRIHFGQLTGGYIWKNWRKELLLELTISIYLEKLLELEIGMMKCCVTCGLNWYS